MIDIKPSLAEKMFCQTEISVRILVPIFFGIIGSLGIPTTLWYVFRSSGFDLIFGMVALLFMVILWFVMVWGELRKKAVRILFNKNSVEVQQFFGYGRKRVYSYDVFEGYYIGLLPALPKPYEQLIMMLAGKQVFKVSEFYFSNYQEVKTFLIDHFTFLGVREYNNVEELKEIFDGD